MPGKVDRVIAASFAFGTTQTFQTEVDAYRNYPQVVIALKNAYHKFLKEGIAPIAAAGEFRCSAGSGSPLRRPEEQEAEQAEEREAEEQERTGGSGDIFEGNNNADNSRLAT